MENFWRSNIWDTVADILVNYKWGALLEMKEILWLRFKARRMPSTLFLCVPGWPEIGEQNSHALSLYITSHYWIKFIGAGFDFKTISKLLRNLWTKILSLHTVYCFLYVELDALGQKLFWKTIIYIKEFLLQNFTQLGEGVNLTQKSNQ